MKTYILQAFQHALTQYCQKADRGYSLGIFSRARHSFKKTPKIETLESSLLQSKDETEALDILTQHLTAPDATFNHHSFNSYLLDALRAPPLCIDFSSLHPHAIKTYQGILYRGTSQPPSKIFAEGFADRDPSHKIEDYLKFKNDSTGVSTTKDFKSALRYLVSTQRSGSGRYIYEINYRGELGYDILATGRERDCSMHPLFHPHRHNALNDIEVNIQGGILNTDIIAVHIIDSRGIVRHENPNYQASLMTAACS